MLEGVPGDRDQRADRGRAAPDVQRELTGVLARSIVLLACLAGCDVEAPGRFDETRNIDAPALGLGIVQVVVGYDDNGTPIFEELRPGVLLEGVTISSSIRLHFNRFLLPSSISRQSICLQPATGTPTIPDECQSPSQFVAVENDPVHRRIVFRQADGQPLLAGETYRLTVFAPVDENAVGLRAFDGAPLAVTATYDFVTAAAGPEIYEPLPSVDTYCGAVACFDDCGADNLTCLGDCEATDQACIDACEAARQACVAPCALQVDSGPYQPAENPPNGLFSACGFSPCHGVSAATPDLGAAMGLDLTSNEGLIATAIGIVAHHSQQGQTPTVADQSPQRFGRAMPIIDPGNPGNSYAMYKMLVNPFNFEDISDGALEDQLRLEIERLRDSAIVGLPMPAEFTAAGPNGFVPNEPADSEAAVERIGSWISHGAPTSCP